MRSEERLATVSRQLQKLQADIEACIQGAKVVGSSCYSHPIPTLIAITITTFIFTTPSFFIDLQTSNSSAQDATDAADRKSYYDAVRGMWDAKSGLQKQEMALLQQMKTHQELRSSLRCQLLEKQRALLQLGSSISRRTCNCPVQVQRLASRLSFVLNLPVICRAAP